MLYLLYFFKENKLGFALIALFGTKSYSLSSLQEEVKASWIICASYRYEKYKVYGI